MADIVDSQTLFDGAKRTIRKFTYVNVDSSESDVKKVDISTLTGTPTAVSIDQVWFNVSGMAVIIEFDHTTDDEALVLQGTDHWDFREFGGISDPGSTGGTGDILFTTAGQAANDSYTIILDIRIT
jgi:hypothetical protein